jgi:hypothetical protein
MVPTEGDRDEACGLYTRCLAGHVQMYQPIAARRKANRERGVPSQDAEVPASCPATCASRTPLDERATDYQLRDGTTVWKAS